MKKIFKSIVLMSLMLGVAVVGFGGAEAQAASYTATDVAGHNTASNCWMIINNNVYNLTSFVSSHSGGSAAIIAQCGKDGTASFNSGPHSGSTLNAISSLKLGKLTTVTTTATATVNPTLTRISLAPRGHSIKVGDTIQLTTKTKDQNGVNFVGAAITFSSSDETVATVGSTTGLVTGIAVGKTTITATAVNGDITVTTHRTVKVKEIPKGLSQYKGDNKEDNEKEGKDDEHLNQGQNQGNNGHQDKAKNEKNTSENEND